MQTPVYDAVFSMQAAISYGYLVANDVNGKAVPYTCITNFQKYGDWRNHYKWPDAVCVGQLPEKQDNPIRVDATVLINPVARHVVAAEVKGCALRHAYALAQKHRFFIPIHPCSTAYISVHPDGKNAVCHKKNGTMEFLTVYDWIPYLECLSWLWREVSETEAKARLNSDSSAQLELIARIKELQQLAKDKNIVIITAIQIQI